MCVVSNMGSEYGRTFPNQWPNWVPDLLPPQPITPLDLSKLIRKPDDVTREEFNALKAELESLKKLLQAAKIYDRETGQQNCEHDEKIALFKRLAELTGVDLSEIFSGEHQD